MGNHNVNDGVLHTLRHQQDRHVSTTANPEELGVSPLGLFFDLVFVFSITQVAALLAADPSVEGLITSLPGNGSEAAPWPSVPSSAFGL